jgi:hypothetical protein
MNTHTITQNKPTTDANTIPQNKQPRPHSETCYNRTMNSNDKPVTRMTARLKLNDEIHNAIVEAVSTGLTLAYAAAAARVHYSTFRRWMVHGELAASGDPNYSENYERERALYEDVKGAEARLIAESLERVKRAADKDARNWTSQAWLLERRFGYVAPEEGMTEGMRRLVQVCGQAGVDVNELAMQMADRVEASLLSRAVSSGDVGLLPKEPVRQVREREAGRGRNARARSAAEGGGGVSPQGRGGGE